MFRAHDCQANLETRVIINFMRDPGLILAELEHRGGIGTTYSVPIRGVILDEKTQNLNYDGPILVDKRKGLAEVICNYLPSHILNMPVCHTYIISHLDLGYAILLEFYNHTLEDVLAHDLVDLTLVRKVLKDVVVGLILLHINIIFYSDISNRKVFLHVEAHGI